MKRRIFALITALSLPLSSLAEELFPIPNALRELDHKLSQIKADPSGFISNAVSSQITKWTGASPSIQRAENAGRHTYRVHERGITAIEQMIQDPENAKEISEHFWDGLKGDAKDMLLSVLPRRVREAYDTAQRFRDNVDYYSGWARKSFVAAQQLAERASNALDNGQSSSAPTAPPPDLDTEIASILNGSLERAAANRQQTQHRAEALEQLNKSTARLRGSTGENILDLVGTMGQHALQVRSELDRRRSDALPGTTGTGSSPFTALPSQPTQTPKRYTCPHCGFDNMMFPPGPGMVKHSNPLWHQR